MNEIRVLIDKWNLALKSRDPIKVVELYAADAILIPTLSNIVRHNHEEIEDYFAHFQKVRDLKLMKQISE